MAIPCDLKNYLVCPGGNQEACGIAYALAAVFCRNIFPASDSQKFYIGLNSRHGG